MHPLSEEGDGSVELCRLLVAVQTLARRDSRSEFELAVVARDSLGRHVAFIGLKCDATERGCRQGNLMR